MKAGDKVTIRNEWFADYGKTLTGTIQKIFKNGKVAVAVDQIRNKSDDCRKTLHFPSSMIIG